MKQPYKSVLQRSDMCRFFKNKVGRVFRVTLLIDLLLLASLFFHHYCYLAEFESDKSQKAVKSDYLGSRKINKGDDSVINVPDVEGYSDKAESLEEKLLSFLKHKYPALFFLILANAALGGVVLYTRLKTVDILRRLARRRIRHLAPVSYTHLTLPTTPYV